jgi:hypothetical protein
MSLIDVLNSVYVNGLFVAVNELLDAFIII